MSRVPFLCANVTRHFRSHDRLVYNVTNFFAEIKHVLREDAGLELAVKKTQILSKNMSLDQLKERATNFIHSDPSLEPCRAVLDSEDDLSLIHI